MISHAPIFACQSLNRLEPINGASNGQDAPYTDIEPKNGIVREWLMNGKRGGGKRFLTGSFLLKRPGQVSEVTSAPAYHLKLTVQPPVKPKTRKTSNRKIMKKEQKAPSIRKLAEITGHDRASIRNWLSGVTVTSLDQALALIAEHEASAAKPKGAIDPATGLSWYNSHLREKTMESRRERIAENQSIALQYIETATHEKIIKLLCDKLDPIPEKARTQLALSDTQVTGIRRMTDEARAEASKNIRQA